MRPRRSATKASVCARDRRDERHEERGHEQRQPDDAELGERLHVERVTVAHDQERRPSLVPEILERPRALADEWMLATGVPGDAKLLASPVPGDAEEPLVEVDSHDRVGVETLLEARSHAARGPPTATSPSATAATHAPASATSKTLRDLAEGITRRATARPRAAAATDTATATTHDDGHSLAFPDRRGRESVLGRQRVQTRPVCDARGRRCADDERRPEKSEPSRIEATAPTRPTTSAAHAPRENVKYSVDTSDGKRSRRRQRRARARAWAATPSGEEHAERCEQPECVPVPERLREPVRVERVVEASRRSGKRRVASAYAETSVMPTSAPATTAGPSPRRRTSATASATAT